MLRRPNGVACSAFDELVVADDDGDMRVAVFSASGEMLTAMAGDFSGIAMHGGTVFAQAYTDSKCVVFT